MTTFIACLEGQRGTGKSTVSRYLREQLPNTTLINATGFNNDDYRQPANYYDAWMSFFRQVSKNKSVGSTFVLDRFFFSEVVYATLYKDYSFFKKHDHLLREIESMDNVLFHYIYLYSENDIEIGSRLQERGKLPFHTAVENVDESFKQKKEYENLYVRLEDFARKNIIPNLFTCKICVDGKTTEEIAKEIDKYTSIKEWSYDH